MKTIVSERTIEADMEKRKNMLLYIFHVHLDRRIDRRPCVLDDTHPPGYGRIDVLGPTSPDLCVHPLGAVCILRRRQLRALAESADQLLERLILRFCLA